MRTWNCSWKTEFTALVKLHTGTTVIYSDISQDGAWRPSEAADCQRQLYMILQVNNVGAYITVYVVLAKHMQWTMFCIYSLTV